MGVPLHRGIVHSLYGVYWSFTCISLLFSRMTHAERLQHVRQKCVEANPQILKGEWDAGIGSQPECWIPRDIRLADVLLALQTHLTSSTVMSVCGRICFGDDVSWNMRKDSLDDQSEETISFLHSLLV